MRLWICASSSALRDSGVVWDGILSGDGVLATSPFARFGTTLPRTSTPRMLRWAYEGTASMDSSGVRRCELVCIMRKAIAHARRRDRVGPGFARTQTLPFVDWRMSEKSTNQRPRST